MEPILQARDLKKYFRRRTLLFAKRKEIRAVDGVDFDLLAGEALGLVGESGSGKSTLGRLVLKLEKLDEGAVLFKGQDLHKKSEREMRLLRKDLQIIFQDPYASLNPRMTVRQILTEPFELFRELLNGENLDAKLKEILNYVGLRENSLARYPHEFSGGQRQRIGIARAVSLRPQIIVCDEPVSALDVSIQAQILNLLKDLQRDFGFTYLFISHDLRVIRHMCERVLVMYQGKIVERGTCESVFQNPQDVYTKRLLKSVPKLNV